MINNILKITLATLIASVSLNAYDVEKNGSWYYVYNNSDLVGAYSTSWNDKYMVGCDSPKKPQNEKTYRETNSYAMSAFYATQREAKNVIIRYCKKR